VRRENFDLRCHNDPLVVAVYWPVSRFEFVFYDDTEFVTENNRSGGLDLAEF